MADIFKSKHYDDYENCTYYNRSFTTWLMTFRTNNFGHNILDLMRKVGYKPLRYTPEGELNCVRPLLGNNYPRFHIYLREDPKIIQMNIHLDQKKPSYEGTTAHGGDYDSEVVKQEVERIKAIIFNL